MNCSLALCTFYIILTAAVFPQISWKFNAEAGYFKTSGEDLVFQDDLVTRLNGQLKFDFSNSPHEGSLLINVHPEYLGTRNKSALLKINFNGNYYYYSENFNWGLNFSVIKNNYFGDLLNVKYDIFTFQPSLTTTILGRPLSTIVGYTSQKIDYAGSITYDLIFSQSEYLLINSRYLASGIGVYAEKFIVENEYDFYPFGNQKNEGWRVGPMVNIKYLKNFLLSSSYRVLLHSSDAVESPSYEHQVTFIAGKLFLEHYSVFILADFYFRDFKLVTGKAGNELIYSPVNQENKYSFKFAYELNKNTELFFRSGYSKENVDYITSNIAGWSFTLGFELR